MIGWKRNFPDLKTATNYDKLGIIMTDGKINKNTL